MKKQLFRLLFLCLVMTAGLGFMACSSDDDDAGGDTRLVGKWYKDGYDHTSGWLFNSNGTCQYNEWGGRGGSLTFKAESKATWKTSGNKLIYHMDYGDGDYDHYEFEYSISEDSTTLTLQKGDEGKGGVYIKSN